jgi:micrococcal nuclease
MCTYLDARDEALLEWVARSQVAAIAADNYAVEGLVGGRRVRLELDVQERDRYGRLLAYVWIGDLMINAELVRRGYAQVMTVPPNVRYQALFLRLQRDARGAGRGLWRGA